MVLNDQRCPAEVVQKSRWWILEYHWWKTKSEDAWTSVIGVYLVVFTDNHPVTLFWVTQFLLGGHNTEVHLESCCWRVCCASGKVIRICSMVDSSFKAELMEVVGATSCKVGWEDFEHVEPEEEDRTFSTANLATCVLDLCPSCLTKAA